MIVGTNATCTLQEVGKRKNFGVAAEIGVTEVILHPLPVHLQHDTEKFWFGQEIIGRYGHVHDTGKIDASGKKIFIQYFIPQGDDYQERILKRYE